VYLSIETLFVLLTAKLIYAAKRKKQSALNLYYATPPEQKTFYVFHHL